MSSVGQIWVDIVANTSGFDKALQKARSEAVSFAQGLAGSGNQAGKTIDSLNAKLDHLTKELNKTEIGSKHFKNLKNEIDRTKNSLDRATSSGSGFKGLIASFATGISVGSIVAGTAALTKMGMQAEQTRVSFTTFLGSAEKADAALKKLNEFANVTPFTNDDVIKAGKSLLAFGITTEKLVPSLKAIGDISSATGKDFNELAIIYGKARVSGTLYAEDINQLTEAGIPIIDQFAKMMGVSADQVKKMASEGQIKFPLLEKAFHQMTTTGGRFADMMKKQSDTGAGMLSTLQGVLQTLGKELGKELVEAAKPAIAMLIDMARSALDLVKAFKEFKETHPIITALIQNLSLLGLGFIGIAAAVGTVKAVMLGGMIPSFAAGTKAALAFSASMAPVLVVIAAAVAGFTLGYKVMDYFGESARKAGAESMKAFTESYEKTNKAIESWSELSKKQNLNKEETAKLNAAKAALNQRLREEGINVNFANLSYKQQQQILRELAYREMDGLNKKLSELMKKYEEMNSSTFRRFYNNLTFQNQAIEGQLNTVMAAQQAAINNAETLNNRRQQTQETVPGQIPTTKLLYSRKQIEDFYKQKGPIQIEMEIGKEGFEDSEFLQKLRQLEEKGIVINKVDTEGMTAEAFEKLEYATNQFAKTNLAGNVKGALEGTATSLSTELQYIQKNFQKEKISFTIDQSKIRGSAEEAAKIVADVLMNKKLPVAGITVKEDKETFRSLFDEGRKEFDKLAKDKPLGVVAKVYWATETVNEVVQLVGNVANSVLGAMNQRLEMLKQKIANTMQSVNWTYDVFATIAEKNYQRDVEAFEQAQEEKLSSFKDMIREMQYASDEEYQHRKALLEKEHRERLSADEASYLAKVEQLHTESADKEQAQMADNLMAEDYDALKKAREEELQRALEDLKTTMETERNDKEIEMNRQQLEREGLLDEAKWNKMTNDEKRAAFEQTLTKTGNEKKEEGEKKHNEQMKNIKKQMALLNWAATMATFQQTKHMNYRMAMITAITSAASSFAQIMSGMAPIIGLTMGAALPLALGVAGGVSGLILGTGMAAANMALAVPAPPPPADISAARGGVVSGPGGPTDDLISARISNGEGVIDANRTSKLIQSVDNAIDNSQSKSISIVNRLESGAIQALDWSDALLDRLSEKLVGRIQRYAF